MQVLSKSPMRARARLVGLEPGSVAANPEAWLTTVTTRFCLGRLRRCKREDYVGRGYPNPSTPSCSRKTCRAARRPADRGTGYGGFGRTGHSPPRAGTSHGIPSFSSA